VSYFGLGFISAGVEFSTWNPSDKHASITLSNGNRTEASASNNQGVRATLPKSTGKWLAEITVTSGANIMFGLGNASANLSFYPGGDANSWAYYGANGNIYTSNSPTGYGTTYGAGDVISLAWDATGGKLYFAKNGVWQASGNPAAGTGFAFSGLSGSLMLMVAAALGSQNTTLNTGQAAFTVAVPSGFSPWTS
jgi:hypothetical protein